MLNKRIKIKLENVDNAAQFVKLTEVFNDDVNIYENKTILDGKSLMGIIGMGLGKVIEVELISDNIDAQCDFDQVMRQFKVGE